eukprot:4235059-Pleurochrysis_carterae.AAC.1
MDRSRDGFHFCNQTRAKWISAACACTDDAPTYTAPSSSPAPLPIRLRQRHLHTAPYQSPHVSALRPPP